MVASHVYVRPSALSCFYSHISTRTFRRALTASLDSCKEIKSAPSVATKSGRVWRKVSESDARSVRVSRTEKQPCDGHCGTLSPFKLQCYACAFVSTVLVLYFVMGYVLQCEKLHIKDTFLLHNIKTKKSVHSFLYSFLFIDK